MTIRKKREIDAFDRQSNASKREEHLSINKYKYMGLNEKKMPLSKKFMFPSKTKTFSPERMSPSKMIMPLLVA